MRTHTNFKKSLVLTAIVGLLGTGGLASASESAELRALRAEIARLRAENRAEIQGLKQELALSQSQGRANSKVVYDKLEAQEQKLEQQVRANTVEEQAHRNLVFSAAAIPRCPMPVKYDEGGSKALGVLFQSYPFVQWYKRSSGSVLASSSSGAEVPELLQPK